MSSTGYASQRKKIADIIKDAESHFRSRGVDEAYEAELGDQIEGAEDICTQKDHKMDLAMKAIKDADSAKKDLKAILPKGFGTLFYGDPASWPSFRKIFVHCLDLDPSVAAATMKNLIGDGKLKKSVKSLRTGRDVLDELDRQLGHSFLNSQSILEEVKQAREATTPEEEKALLTLMKNAKRSLSMQDDPMAEQTLLTIPLLITWLQKLLTPNQDALMMILQDTDFRKTSSPITPYFEYLDKLDERISIAVRHRAAQKPGKPKDTKDQKSQGTYGVTS